MTTKKVIVASKLSSFHNVAIIIFIAGIILSFAVHPIPGLFLSIGSALAGAVLSYQLKREMALYVRNSVSDFEATCKQHHVTYKANFSDTDLGFFLGLSEEDATLLICCRTNTLNVYEIKERCIKLREIINVELVVNDLSVYKAGPIASLSAAAIGGIAFGGAGAIVGSLTSGQVGHGKIGAATLKLRANNIEEPLIEVPFISRSIKASSIEAKKRVSLAEKWTNLIEVMRLRLGNLSAA